MTKVDIPKSWAYTEFITAREQNALLQFANSIRNLLRNNGAGRFYRDHIEQESFLPQEYKDIKQRIIDTEKLKDFIFDPQFGDFISFNEMSGAIHEHKDNNENGFIHTRYNLLLSVPDSGGNPIYDGEVINVEERMLWRCEAGLYNHASLPVIGSKPRINISFGFQVKENI
jgi:hypothetical protein